MEAKVLTGFEGLLLWTKMEPVPSILSPREILAVQCSSTETSLGGRAPPHVITSSTS